MMQFFESIRPWRHAGEFLRPGHPHGPPMAIPMALLMALIVVIGHGGCASSKPKGFPDLSPVSGTVTMDGEPLQKAVVMFLSEKGVAASCATDANGRYTLLYRGSADGASPGRNTVTVTTLPDDPNMGVVKERIPAAYNTKSTLTVDVVAGTNTFDFALESKQSGKKP